MRKALMYLLIIGSLAMFSCCSKAVIQYEIVNLGVLPGGTGSYAYNVNDNGQVVGFSDDFNGYHRGFLWDSKDGIQDIGTLGGITSIAHDINNHGQIVGMALDSNDVWRAFCWENGNMNSLSVTNDTSSYAYGINDTGQVVGWATVNGGIRAFLWDSNEGMQNLGSMGEGRSIATDINQDGAVVGMTDYDNRDRGFLWTGSMSSLGLLLGGSFSGAYSINDINQIVGYADTNGCTHAFIWDNINGIQDLGTLGGRDSRAQGINNLGMVVGVADAINGKSAAFLWSNDKMIDLNSLISDDCGWYLEDARGINDLGQIVGCGLYNGYQRAFLLTPVPETSSILALLSGLAGVSGIVWRKKK